MSIQVNAIQEIRNFEREIFKLEKAHKTRWKSTSIEERERAIGYHFEFEIKYKFTGCLNLKNKDNAQQNRVMSKKLNFGPMDEKCFISRSELLQWINHLLEVPVTKVEQLGSGNLYC